MEGSGLTPFALIFMLVSMGSVVALMVYCYWRILREPDGTSEGPTVGPGGGEGL